MITQDNRLRELDFLRGVAILLVLCRHQPLFEFTHSIGWTGVDLFFVLSGFLVSGLLFREYLKYGNIQPGRFLIRRGFKIYPVYYLFYIIYLLPILLKHDFKLVGFLSDMTFTQNYVWIGVGYAYPASWSLAVEEHFYFALAFFLWVGLKKNILKLKPANNYSGLSQMEISVLIIMALCLFFRVITNIMFPLLWPKNFTMTHLRIDSLLAGVLVSYLYYFRIDRLKRFFIKYKLLLYAIAFLGALWTPFLDPTTSFFAGTIGLTFLLISYGIVLIFFLLSNDINRKLNFIFSKAIVDIISKIGVCSYSIYIIHTFFNMAVSKVEVIYHLDYSNYFNFIFTSTLSILAGMFMTYKVENYFLKIRDRYYPKRTVAVPPVNVMESISTGESILAI